MIRDLVAADPALNQAAWENLSEVLESLPATVPMAPDFPPNPEGIPSFKVGSECISFTLKTNRKNLASANLSSLDGV